MQFIKDYVEEIKFIISTIKDLLPITKKFIEVYFVLFFMAMTAIIIRVIFFESDLGFSFFLFANFSFFYFFILLVIMYNETDMKMEENIW